MSSSSGWPCVRVLCFFCYVMAWLALFSLFGFVPNHRLFHSTLEKENFSDRSDVFYSTKGSKKDSDWLIREIRWWGRHYYPPLLICAAADIDDVIIGKFCFSVFDSYDLTRRGEDRKIPRQARPTILRKEIVEKVKTIKNYRKEVWYHTVLAVWYLHGVSMTHLYLSPFII